MIPPSNNNNLRAMMQSKPPPFAYGLVLFLGAAMAPFLLSLDSNMISPFAFRRSLSNGSLYSLRDAEEYSNLQASHEIDHSIEKRALENDEDDKCSRLFLYLPDPFADHGHGSQINTYIMGVTTATFQNRAMILVEPPLEHSRYPGGSQFGCPIDAFHETMTKTSLRSKTKWEVHADFPMGFSRLVHHPAWLSHGCDVPCRDTHSYSDWLQLAHVQRNKGEQFREVTCTNHDGTTSNVVVTADSRLRSYFRDFETSMTRNHPSDVAHQWAINLGATSNEAEIFSNNIKNDRKVWEYVLGLMNKAGFLKFQPWIARDVELFLKSFDLPLNKEYSAIHVRRGDKLEKESRGEVIKYWRSQGHTDPENLPTDYVPFAHYLSQWDKADVCPRNDKGEIEEIMKHNVYIATDDPLVVKQEIADLPVEHINENTILWNECHELTFYMNPTDESAFHLNGDGEHGFKDDSDNTPEGGDNCFMRYHRNIASIADMMILSKAKTFIGEYNSNWGRVIRTMRVRLNSPVVQDDSGEGETGEVTQKAVNSFDFTKVLDTRIAWGSTVARTPGY